MPSLYTLIQRDDDVIISTITPAPTPNSYNNNGNRVAMIVGIVILAAAVIFSFVTAAIAVVYYRRHQQREAARRAEIKLREADVEAVLGQRIDTNVRRVVEEEEKSPSSLSLPAYSPCTVPTIEMTWLSEGRREGQAPRGGNSARS